VTDYLDKAGLTEPLEKMGFFTVGYGCTTCIGNSGPLPEPVAKAVTDGKLIAAAVLSGNRNFEGRISPMVQANYLASPPLVVAYALAGTVDIDLSRQPVGKDADGKDVFLKEIWPSQEEIDAVAEKAILPEMFVERYQNAFKSNEMWNNIAVSGGELYQWDGESTYIQEPPFVDDAADGKSIEPIAGARVLCLLGDSVTTDHISPAGAITQDGPAGRYLQEHGVEPIDFNSFGSRRGNDRIMHRGTFANIRLKNHLATKNGGYTRYLPNGEEMAIFDAAEKYAADSVPLVVLAGNDYGMGSSRDWAAKGTRMLGVKMVIAASYERIHRSNLVGMGVLPLEFPAGETWQTLGLTGEETFAVSGLDDSLEPLSSVTVTATSPDGATKQFEASVRIDTPVELEYFRSGGILPAVLLKLLGDK